MRWWLNSILMLAILLPAPVAWSGEESKDAEKAEKAETKETDKSKAEAKSPIKRLAEVKLDRYLVPARQLNLPVRGRVKTVQEMLDKFEKWSEEDEIGAVLLNVMDLRLSLPDIEALRDGVKKLQDSGKKVVAYMNAGDDKGYLLACAADEIACAPSAGVYLPGMGYIFPFMKGHFQMRGLEFEVITAGKYKYPGFYNRREADDAFKEEFNAVLDGWIEDYYKMIAEGRDLSVDRVKQIVDQCLFDADEALQYGLVDKLAYYEEYRDQILRREKMKKYRGEREGLADINSFQDLMTMIMKEIEKKKAEYEKVGPKIAVLHARGPIIDLNLGPAVASMLICRDDFVKTIEELRKHKSIKAVVMQVDSPGGSGYASDVIWTKLNELDEEKPLVVCMGSVAGSGGYYIALPGRLIFARPTTLTGSIGVLGVFRSAWSLLNRLDYELLPMKRGDKSLLGMGHRTLTKDEHALFQDYILRFYDVFIDRVARSRKMPAEEVRKIAEGRIYTGRQALEIGLIDRLGGLDDAIAAVKEFADIPESAEIRIVHYPRAASLGELLEGAMGVQAMATITSQATTPSPLMTFDHQLRFFSRKPEPLTWMPLPNGQEMLEINSPLFNNAGAPQTKTWLEELLGI